MHGLRWTSFAKEACAFLCCTGYKNDTLDKTPTSEAASQITNSYSKKKAVFGAFLKRKVARKAAGAARQAAQQPRAVTPALSGAARTPCHPATVFSSPVFPFYALLSGALLSVLFCAFLLFNLITLFTASNPTLLDSAAPPNNNTIYTFFWIDVQE